MTKTGLVVWQGRIAEYSDISSFVDEADLQRHPQKSYGHRMVAIGSAARSGSAIWELKLLRNRMETDHMVVKPYVLASPASPAQVYVCAASAQAPREDEGRGDARHPCGAGATDPCIVSRAVRAGARPSIP